MMSESCCTLYIAAGVQRAQVTLLIWNWWQVRPMGRRMVRQEEWSWTWLGYNMLVCYTFFNVVTILRYCYWMKETILVCYKPNQVQHIAMPYFSVLGMLKYGKGWRPQIAEFENCRVWEMQNLRNAEFENCKTWELQDLRKTEFE